MAILTFNIFLFQSIYQWSLANNDIPKHIMPMTCKCAFTIVLLNGDQLTTHETHKTALYIYIN